MSPDPGDLIPIIECVETGKKYLGFCMLFPYSEEMMKMISSVDASIVWYLFYNTASYESNNRVIRERERREAKNAKEIKELESSFTKTFKNSGETNPSFWQKIKSCFV